MHLRRTVNVTDPNFSFRRQQRLSLDFSCALQFECVWCSFYNEMKRNGGETVCAVIEFQNVLYHLSTITHSVAYRTGNSLVTKTFSRSHKKKTNFGHFINCWKRKLNVEFSSFFFLISRKTWLQLWCGSERKWKNHINYYTYVSNVRPSHGNDSTKVHTLLEYSFTIKCPSGNALAEHIDNFPYTYTYRHCSKKLCWESSIRAIRVHYLWWLNCTDTKHEQILLQFHNWLHFHEIFIVAHKQAGTLHCHYQWNFSYLAAIFISDTVRCIV